MEDQQIDFTKLKYVLYARKSTKDESRQIRSIVDQIHDCQLLAKRLGLHIVKVLREEESAKKPHKRPIFTQILKDLKSGIYDGIVSWNPDRLARNMLEGGMIIDMIDQEQIKDLKFVTHYFTKDANGKMLLGMAFVLSKQYSDDLSQKVTRGVRRSFQEGKSPIPKHGYTRDKDGYYRPDGKNYDLICEAWNMRHQGDSLETIADYMDKNGYGRAIKKDGRVVKMTFKTVGEIFHDPFYYGVLIQAKQTVDLRDIYDFQPATTEDIYNDVQQLSQRRLKPFNTKKRANFYPFKAMIICSFCSHNMVVGPSTSAHGNKYLNYRCDNKNCMRKKKSIRAKVILEFIYDLLKNGLNLTEQEYKDYYESMTVIADQNREKLLIQQHSKQAQLNNFQHDMREIALGIPTLKKDSTARKINEDKLAELEDQKESLEEEINTIKQQLSDPEKDKLSIEEFLNLAKNATDIVQTGDAIAKDVICKMIFLNLIVNEEKVLSYKAKPQFELLLKQAHNPSGRGAES